MLRKETYVLILKCLLVFLFLIINLSGFCQVTVLEKNAYILNAIYDLQVQKREVIQGDNYQEFYSFKAKQGEKESKALELKSLEKEVLEAALKKVFLEATDIKYLENGTIKNQSDKTKFENDFKEFFDSTFPEIMVAAIRIGDYEPIAGEIYIHDRVRAFIGDDNKSQYYTYRLRKLPVIPKNIAQFNNIELEITSRINSLLKFKSQIDSLENIVNNIKLEINDVKNSPLYKSNKDLYIKSIDLINNTIKDFNTLITSAKETKVDFNVSYEFSYPSVSINYLETNKQKSSINNYNKISSKISENFLLFSQIKGDVDSFKKTLNDFVDVVAREENNYQNLNQQYEVKKDSLERALYTFTETFTPERVKSKILELEFAKSNLIEKLNSQIDILNSNFVRGIHNTLILSSVQIVFQEGFIENITVRGDLDKDPLKVLNKPLEFTNNYPIGFSSKKDFDNLSNTRLFEKRNRSRYSNLKIYLDDIFDYKYNLDLNTRDYSPKDGAVIFQLAKKTPLTRIESSKILEAKIFTDFVGLEGQKPNGIIQTEIGRRINLYTRRYPRKLLFLNEENFNYGFLSYAEPSVVFSKIEEKNRSLPLNSYNAIVNGTIFTRKYVPVLKVREFQHLSVGADLNGFILDFPVIKSSLLLNFGIRFGRTAVIDSSYTINGNVIQATDRLNEFGVSTIELFPELNWKIQPERRYGFTFTYKYSWFNLLNPVVMQVSKEPDFNVDEKFNKGNLFSNIEFLGFLDPNKSDSNNGRLFFRYRFFYNNKNSNTNFYQAQFGYSFNLLTRNQPRRKFNP